MIIFIDGAVLFHRLIVSPTNINWFMKANEMPGRGYAVFGGGPRPAPYKYLVVATNDNSPWALITIAITTTKM